MRAAWCAAICVVLLIPAMAAAAEWMQFRGPGGLGVSEEKSVPAEWGPDKNIAWQAELPGPGASSPIVVKGRVYLTCYTGYGIEVGKSDQKDLRRHLLCFDRQSGQQL